MDRYAQIANAPVVGSFVKTAGLPVPVELERHSPGDPAIRGRVLLGAAPGGRLAGTVARALASAGAEAATELRDDLRGAAAEAGLDAAVWSPEAAVEDESFKALVFDATGIASTDALGELRAFFSPAIRRVERSGRVIVFGTPPSHCAAVGEAIAQRALEGFTRSAAKEVRRGATGQLVLVEPGAEDGIESTLRFLLSPRSAYVSGQVIRVGSGAPAAVPDWERPLDGRVALVTGASRGIGASIAATLARDGAHVVGLDIPDLGEGMELALDVTDPEAPRTIASHLAREHGGADVIVHNAGITRDKTLGRMDEDRWDSVIGVNLTAPERITTALMEHDGALKDAARIVCVSSISGIAGNAGQTNYATSKAGVIGLVDALAPEAAARGATVNAVAPGFIETEMTARMPLATREVGRRMNSLSQGGLPVDVAETVAWFASPASGGVNGNVVRVCGQSLLGGLEVSVYLKAALGALPGAGRLPFVAGGGGEMPELKLEARGRRAEPDRVADYARVCGFRLRDELPPTYPHVLAFPLHMRLMTDASFPYTAVGLVHVANRIVVRRPLRLGEPLDLSARPKSTGEGTFALLTEGRVDGEVVWEEESTMLSPGGNAPRTEDFETDFVAEWRLPGDLGRRYAAVSGDRNPIHMHPLTAKPFGFPRPIAHGMWTKARCLAALEPSLPRAYEVTVQFRKPILLPGTVTFERRAGSFRVRSGDRTHLLGRIWE